MKKSLGKLPAVYPMPVLMIATYGEDGKVDVMNMAWGGVCDTDKVALNLDATHKTVENLRKRGAFTLSIADLPHLAESDFFGIASGNKMADKFERSGLHAVKSAVVDAPVIEEYPLTMECRVLEFQDQPYGLRVLGEIVNVLAEERVLDENGKVDVSRLDAFVFDQFKNGYYALGEKAGQAWKSGVPLMKETGK